MDLVERVVGHVAALAGAPVRVLGTMVDHHERCVADVVLADGTPAVVKGDNDLERSSREARVLGVARDPGLPVPRVIASALERRAGVLVLERVGGEWLAPERPTAAWRASGAGVRALHRTAGPGAREVGGPPELAA